MAGKLIEPIRNRDVRVEAPASKAHTLRALIISSLAPGRSLIRKPLMADDQRNVIKCLRELGVEITQAEGEMAVTGLGGRYLPATEELNVGESGVGMNFLASAACMAARPVRLTGAQRITERPIGEVISGIRQLGCRADYLGRDGFPPVRLAGGGIPGGVAEMSGAVTSQYFSSIAISGACARNEVTLRCSDEMTEKPYFDITLQMMSDFGAEFERDGYRQVRFPGGNPYAPREFTIEGDFSSAAFFFLTAAVCGSKVFVSNLRADTSQGDRGVIGLLAAMGCHVSKGDNGVGIEGGELKAIERDMSDMPDLVPPMAVAAAFAAGTSRFTNIAQLRVKECDRLAVMAAELGKMGIEAECDQNSLWVTGGNPAPASIDPHNDHRIAMSFAVAGLATDGQEINNPGCVAKSFPDFWERLEAFTK